MVPVNQPRAVVAEDLYLAKLEVRRRKLPRVLTLIADLWCAAMGGLFELSSAGEIVVRRRTDDSEVLRVPAGGLSDAAMLLNELHEQLSAQSPAEFRETWGISE